MTKLLIFNAKQNKIKYIIPLLFSYIIMPLIAYTITSNTPDDELQDVIFDILKYLHILIPILSVWWILLYFSSFFSKKGNELIYFYHKTHSILGIFITNIILFLILFTPTVFIYNSIFKFSPTWYFEYLLESLVISSIYYWFSFITQNIGSGLIVIIIYSLYVNIFDITGSLEKISIFPSNTEILETQHLPHSLYFYLGLFIAFTALGTIASKYSRKYT